MIDLYARHEQTVLRFFMERVRSPQLACDLTAETFATALVQAFDPSRQTEAEWVLGIADTQLLRAYRVGTVDDAARIRLKLPRTVLDDRTLDRVWQLRGEDRNEARKPRPSAQISFGVSGHREVPDDVVLAGVAEALHGAAGRAHGGRRRRRRLVIAARVALAVATVTWVVAEAVVPDRPASASQGRWLPYEADGVTGEFPRTWYFEQARQLPFGHELATFTTTNTGEPAARRCGAIGTLGASDALVAIFDGRPRIPGSCGAEIETTSLGDGLWGVVATGPETPRHAEDEAREILDRVAPTDPA